jgi:hypothetical protein
LDKRPHFTSGINWCVSLGLGLLKQVKRIDEPWVAIMDHSIGNATNKALVVLRVPLSHFLKKNRAIRLEDGECIGVKVVDKVTGESTAVDLQEIFEDPGDPVFIIKMMMQRLKKALRFGQ